MHNIMPQYHQYIVEAHTETLLPQYLAMYRTTVDTKEYYYIVLRNVFSPTKKIHKKYDLKVCILHPVTSLDLTSGGEGVISNIMVSNRADRNLDQQFRIPRYPLW